MSPGSSTESYPAFAHIGLRENPGKNLNQVTCPDRESNPGHLVSRPDALTVTPQIGQKRRFSYKACRSRERERRVDQVLTLPFSETETLGHVLGFCKKGELLRNNRHHRARTAIANLLRNRGWEVHEEIHCVSEDDSHRRVDVIAINRRTQKAMVLDPTIALNETRIKHCR
ncbi:hypothetical protein ANN_02507 [Periplaneta americana]|uniref:Uncharacterized protein n=1 Tax=Periplaneta americana TaxID=6978 RepID=A0ABQ8TZR0_PERAM|nr:hypothetical protein ANN_02507 [Periplaneta americana]